MEWISVKERLPDPGNSVLIIVNGKPCRNISLVNAYEFGNYSDAEGWIVEEYPEWERPEVTHWMPLPELPNERMDCEADVEKYEKMTIEAAIKHCEEVGGCSPCTPCEREHMRLAAWLSELVSLRAQQKQPNEPLTLGELRQMDGEPVWLHTFSAVQKKTNIAQWAILEAVNSAYAVFVRAGCNARSTKRFSNYGGTWLAYRFRPEQEESN